MATRIAVPAGTARAVTPRPLALRVRLSGHRVTDIALEIVYRRRGPRATTG